MIIDDLLFDASVSAYSSRDRFIQASGRIVDLASMPFAEGIDVRPLVHAQAGNTVPGNVFVSYCANGQTATYTASGTTLNYSVTLLT